MTDLDMYEAVTSNLEMMQDKDEILWSLERIRKHLGKPAKMIVELGSYQGGNLCMLAQLMDGGNLISVDPGGEGCFVNEDIVESLIDPAIELRIIHDVSLSNPTLSEIKGILNGKKFDVVWIDSNHTASAAESEKTMYERISGAPAVIAFHDIAFGYMSYHPTCQVGNFWNRVKWSYSYEEKRSKVDSDYFGTGLLLL